MHVAAEDDSPAAQSAREKELGNAAYKSRDFATAMEHYKRAVELDPTNMVLLTNQAGTYGRVGAARAPAPP